MKLESEASRQVDIFFEAYRQSTYARGELLVLPDDSAPPPITYLRRGVVVQYDITSNGDKVIVNVFKPGAFFPVSGAVNQATNGYYFEAATEVVASQAPPRAVQVFLKEKPEIVYDLLQRLYRGLDGVLRRMVLLLGETADKRVVHELLISAERFGIKQPDGSIHIRVTAATLAQQTGLARETVSRELKKLREAGRVDVTRGTIIIYP